MSVTVQAVVDIAKERPSKTWVPRKEKSHLNIFWDRRYNSWSEIEYKEDVRVDRGTFELILNRISANIHKTPTNVKPNLLETHRQLAMALYKLDHGCPFGVICDLFGVSINSAIARRMGSRVQRIYRKL